MSFKHLVKRLFCLPLSLTVLIALPAYIWVIHTLQTDHPSPWTYISYAYSAYALIITLTQIWSIRKKPLWKKIKTSRWVKDEAYRSKMGLFNGLTFNFLYAIIHLYSGFYYQNSWFIALAFYYLLLSFMRGMLLRQLKKTPIGTDPLAEWYRYRQCGIILLMMNQALSAIVIYIVNQNKGFAYSGLLIYVMAAYTFYNTISAIVHVIRVPKLKSPLMSAIQITRLMAALVSMLSLETAMLDQFGKEQPSFRLMMTSISGTVVCIFVLGMAIYMIIHASIRIRKKEGDEIYE